MTNQEGELLPSDGHEESIDSGGDWGVTASKSELLDILSSEGVSPQTLQTVEVYMSEHYSGMMPPHEWLETVEGLAAGSTEKIVGDFLAERQHLRETRTEALELDGKWAKGFIWYQFARLLAAWSITITLAVAGVILIATGRSIEGFVWLTIELGILAAVFLGSRSSRRGTKNTNLEVARTDGESQTEES